MPLLNVIGSLRPMIDSVAEMFRSKMESHGKWAGQQDAVLWQNACTSGLEFDNDPLEGENRSAPAVADTLLFGMISSKHVLLFAILFTLNSKNDLITFL